MILILLLIIWKKYMEEWVLNGKYASNGLINMIRILDLITHGIIIPTLMEI